MGSIAHLIIDEFPIFYSKNGYHDEIASLIFLDEDFATRERLISERNTLIWGTFEADEEELDEFEKEEVSSFKSTAGICLERLGSYGLTKRKSRDDFESALKIHIEEDFYEFFKNDEITYDSYLNLVSEIIETKYQSTNNSYEEFKDYLVENDLMIEYQPVSTCFYSVLSTREPDSVVEYDIDDLMQGGWVEDPKQDIRTKKIIVFTEGKTDTEFIKLGLKVFMPHLLGLYHFIDFESSRYEANASRLVHSIKSFVGSGIENLIIAFFDNDAVGEKELRNLRNVILPKNIKILKYPDASLLKEYPTIGPTGAFDMDVNGKAGSIEMYLGKDCLTSIDKLNPVKWSGFVESVNSYQGVVTDKHAVQERYRHKMKNFLENDNALIWEEMELLLNSLISAFKD